MAITAGTIIPYAGSSAPSGFLLCYGQAISRTTYAALFAVIGTTYGAGDGSTTFNVPDLRGRVVAGQDDMGGTSANRLTGQTGGVDGDVLGGSGGAETHTLTTAQMPAHGHALLSDNSSSGAIGGLGLTNVGEQLVGSPTTGTQAYYTTGVYGTGAALVQNTGGGGAHNNVQPTLILNYIIATVDDSGSGLVSTAGITIDGGGSAITTGVKGYVEVPFSGTITGWTLLADQTGSIVIDVWKDTYANYPPTSGDTITGADKPTISSSNKGQNLSVSSWTTSVTAGDVLGFNVDSCSTITRATLVIRISRS